MPIVYPIYEPLTLDIAKKPAGAPVGSLTLYLPAGCPKIKADTVRYMYPAPPQEVPNMCGGC